MDWETPVHPGEDWTLPSPGGTVSRIVLGVTPPPTPLTNAQTPVGTQSLLACLPFVSTVFGACFEFVYTETTNRLSEALEVSRESGSQVLDATSSSVASAASTVRTVVHNNLVESTGPLGRLYRIADVVPSYPVDFEGAMGNGQLLDGAPLSVPFCSGCMPALIEALRAPLDEAHYTCTVCVPVRCPTCDPRFYPRGHVSTDFEVADFHIPLAWGRQLHVMQQFKNAHEKKNLHLGLVSYCERDTDARKEGLMAYASKIAQLQRCPARCYPRWGALPIICWFSPSWPMTEECARFATPWRLHGDDASTVEEASHVLSRQSAQVDENDGDVPMRVPRNLDTGRAAEMGFTQVPDPSTFTPVIGESVDGKANITATRGAVRIAPLGGVAVVHDHRAPQTNLHAAMSRIGGQQAEARKHTYNPGKRTLGHLSTITKFLVTKVFTKEAVAEAAAANGLVDFLCEGKLSPERVRTYVSDIQAGFLTEDKVPAMTKLETTTKADKPGRLVMNKGNVSFVASKAVLACCETILAKYDAPVNIKGRPKSDLIDAITRACSAEGLFEGKGSLKKEWLGSVGVIENDFGHFEYSQNARKPGEDDTAKTLHHSSSKVYGAASDNLRDVEAYCVEGFEGGKMSAKQGLLFVERSIIEAVTGHLPSVFNELGDQTLKAQLKTNFETLFEGSVRTPEELFRRANWRLILHLLCRLSGDGQTSWGNRINNLVVMAIAHLDKPIELFERLLQFRRKTFGMSPEEPRFWCFTIQAKPRYFRPWAEGDDFIAQIAGWDGLGATSQSADVSRCREAQETLKSLGLDASYFLHTSGRAEFIGVHMLVKRGLMTPKVWCPDVTRGLVKAAVGMSAAMRPEEASCYMTRALAFQTRAMMFAGKVTPMHAMYSAYADNCLELNRTHNRFFGGSVTTRLDWNAASELGLEYGTFVDCGKVIDKLRAKTPPAELDMRIQRELVEASVGATVSNEDWANWMMGGASVETDDYDFYKQLPAAIRNKLVATR